ncbi:MAG: dihydrofolate reductase, partial [Alphaproteobacteria bacterium]
LTVIDISPDGGPDAALFPELNTDYWTQQIEAEIDPVGDVPGYRYERWYRAHPPRAL